VMHALDADPHLLQEHHGPLAKIAGDIQRREIEVAALIQRDRGLLIGEVEVFELGGQESVVAQLAGLADDATQHRPRIGR
jgi:hypothetical protein